MKIDSRY